MLTNINVTLDSLPTSTPKTANAVLSIVQDPQFRRLQSFVNIKDALGLYTDDILWVFGVDHYFNAGFLVYLFRLILIAYICVRVFILYRANTLLSQFSDFRSSLDVILTFLFNILA